MCENQFPGGKTVFVYWISSLLVIFISANKKMPSFRVPSDKDTLQVVLRSQQRVRLFGCCFTISLLRMKYSHKANYTLKVISFVVALSYFPYLCKRTYYTFSMLRRQRGWIGRVLDSRQEV